MEHAPSRYPPADLDISRTPQFVCIGWDDNYFPEGMEWFVDFMADKKNADGSMARCSFFVNTNNSFDVHSPTHPLAPRLRAVWRKAQEQGHEIGNHTATHAEGLRLASKEGWLQEMQNCQDSLSRLGLRMSEVKGFRSPFLLYGDATFAAGRDMGFSYDCSVESGFDDDDDGRFALWPYTLDQGVPVQDRIPEVTVGHYPYYWEIPVSAVTVPPRLRRQVSDKLRLAHPGTRFGQNYGKITGLDYNLFIDQGPDCPSGLSGAEFLDTLVFSLKQRLSGSRAPLCFGAHTPLYDPLTLPGPGNQWPEYHQNASLSEMRKAMEDFVDYALTIPEVRITSHAELLSWMQDPRELTAT